MRSTQILLLLCILGAALCSAALTNNGNNPDDCCFQYYQRRIPKQLIVAYEMTRSDCTHKGVILITKKNYPICANPDEPVIDRIMKAIDESKFK
ncbi:C-C motif chemokine 18-like [Coregonus clupeaformis]|uniref:C-C motif chemokine 18-like n=1 Tax=Coregonus clupeaformis TaxID=59861 RepID=UPI001BDFD9C5|nr:C-C motif chemokine 18-like [Coregonus clupeaformis]